MNCPKCRTFNESSNLFCINCGETMRLTANPPPTMMSPPASQNFPQSNIPTQDYPSLSNRIGDLQSSPTIFTPNPNFNQSQPNYNQSQQNFNQSQQNFNPSMGNFNPSMTGFNPSLAYQAPPRKKSRAGLWIGLSFLFVLLLGGGIVAAVVLMNKTTTGTEALPEHLGMFFQNGDKTTVNEIKKQDFSNALDGKEQMLKDSALPTVEEKPNLILYSDGKDIPLNDLKLIQLDSMTGDGAMKQIEFKAAPVEGKPEMKRIWFPDGLANGKYAFALMDGFFDEGKHKFWAFQVSGAKKTDNGDLAKSITIGLKPKAAKTTTTTTVSNTNSNVVEQPKVPPPPSATTVYCTSNNVVLRSGSSQNTAKIGSLFRGQKLYVISYSGEYETFVSKNGQTLYSNYAYVQTESGKRGWVYAAYIK